LPAWLSVPLVMLHVIVAIALILIVLLQAGKGAGIGAAFGGASQTVFGPRGPGSFLGKLTTAAAGIFMVTSLVLAVFSSQHGGSVVLTAPTPRPPASPTGMPPEPAAPSVPGAPERSGSPESPPPQNEPAGTTSEQQ
jgi:preprotein translocase subunit SecG